MTDKVRGSVGEVMSGKITDIDAEKFKRLVVDCVRGALFALDYERGGFESYVRWHRIVHRCDPDPSEVSNLWPGEED